MTAVLLLYVLILIDGACSAYRDAAGRDGRIDKRAYYRRAIIRGVLAGHGVVLPAMAFLAAAFATGDNGRLPADILDATRYACYVALPYGAIVTFGLLMRLAPSVDLRSVLSVVLFAPLLFIRPAVALGAALFAAWRVPRTEVLLLGLLVVGLTLAVEPMFGWLRRRGITR